MRHITCRFDDGPTFLEHCHHSAFTDAPTLRFLANFCLPEDCTLRVTISIDESNEHHDLHMTLQDRSPTMNDRAQSILWRYEVRPVAEDAPWFEMLAAKYETEMRVTGYPADVNPPPHNTSEVANTVAPRPLKRCIAIS